METLGSLIDKFSIATIRLQHAKVDTFIAVENQKNDLKNEIDQYLQMALNGSLRLQEPKFKNYKGENASGVSFNKFSDAMESLFKANFTLWNLEDDRRDKNKEDSQIRDICDLVASHNRIRNDSVDEINKLFVELINHEKP